MSKQVKENTEDERHIQKFKVKKLSESHCRPWEQDFHDIAHSAAQHPNLPPSKMLSGLSLASIQISSRVSTDFPYSEPSRRRCSASNSTAKLRQTVSSSTVGQFSQRRARKSASTSTLSLLSQSALPVSLDNKFHTEALGELLQDDDQFGFVVMDGNGCLFGTVCGSTRNVSTSSASIFRSTVAWQSALRFADLRLEKRHNYVRKVAETCKQLFITDGQRPNVRGLCLAGSAEFKDVLNKSDLFDPRLKAVVIKMIGVSYGGENGFAQAIDLASDALANVKFVQEKKLISSILMKLRRTRASTASACETLSRASKWVPSTN